MTKVPFRINKPDDIDLSIRLIDLTAGDLILLLQPVIKDRIDTSLSEQRVDLLKNKIFTINQLAQENLVGKYHHIKSLIKAGLLTQTPDGKVTGLSVFNYLNQ